MALEPPLKCQRWTKVRLKWGRGEAERERDKTEKEEREEST